jgi:glutamate formiminotransferase
VAPVLECVVNVSEGRDRQVIAGLARAAGSAVLDVHSDPDHHRSVLTLAGPPDLVEEAVRGLAAATVARLDLGPHRGVHPRIGVLDVVPFVALDRALPVGDGPIRGAPSPMVAGSPARAVAARDGFARWAARELALPCFLYGPERSLPDVRRTAWTSLGPDYGPPHPHPTAGASAVGARSPLVAYNLWLTPGATLPAARAVAQRIRGPALRTLGLAVGGGEQVQVSCNLVDPWRVGPGAAYDAVATALADRPGPGAAGGRGEPVGIERAELVGLLPLAVLEAEPRGRWRELGLAPSATIEARLEMAGLDGGRF